ncbi:MAG: hypothetical protein M1832_006218 [Thelocarpon impressellum]|nr:MAG: hypothetical protein M1832_006218 [Thelocarpon impressellum]
MAKTSTPIHPPLPIRITPLSTSSLSNGNLSPPPRRVSRIIRHVRLREAGHEVSEQPWMVFQLVPGDFEQLNDHLKANEALGAFFEHKVRHDYFSSSCRFVLRMPSRTHEYFLSKVLIAIHTQLGEIATGTGQAAEFARHVRYLGSPTMLFPRDEMTEGDGGGGEKEMPKYDPHAPDGVFKHRFAKWPGVVIEVSFSQKRKDLANLAEDYILGSDGNINAVIGLDIDYSGSKRAVLSVWRPRYVEHSDGQEVLMSVQTIIDQEFRDELGNPSQDPASGLELVLQDFGIEQSMDHSDSLNRRIFLSAATLSETLSSAETEADEVETGQARSRKLKPGARKWQRARTPPEELRLDDEQYFAELEGRDAKRAGRGDDDFLSSSILSDEPE